MFDLNSPHHHPDSFDKSCDICNAKASHTQGAYKTVTSHTKNLPKTIATQQVNENSVIISNNSSSNFNQTTAAAATPTPTKTTTTTLSASNSIENSTERGKSRLPSFPFSSSVSFYLSSFSSISFFTLFLVTNIYQLI